MNFEQQSEEYFIQDYTNDFNMFQVEQHYSEEPEVPSSFNDLGSSYIQVRDKRIKKNRSQRKVKKTDQNSENTESAQSKQERRKQRNRAAAQKSRDKQKLLQTQIEIQNKELLQMVQQLTQEKRFIEQELTETRNQLNLIESLQSQNRCTNCQADMSMERVSRPLNVVTRSNLTTFGLMALIGIICVFGIPGNGNTGSTTNLQQKSGNFLEKPSPIQTNFTLNATQIDQNYTSKIFDDGITYRNVNKSTLPAVIYTFDQDKEIEQLESQRILVENCTGPYHDECSYFHNLSLENNFYTAVMQVFTKSPFSSSFYTPKFGDQVDLINTYFDEESQTFYRQVIECNVTRSTSNAISRNALPGQA